MQQMQQDAIGRPKFGRNRKQKVKLEMQAEHTFTQLTEKAGLKFIFSDSEKNRMCFYSYEEKALIIQSNEVMMQLCEGKNNVTHGNC